MDPEHFSWRKWECTWSTLNWISENTDFEQYLWIKNKGEQKLSNGNTKGTLNTMRFDNYDDCSFDKLMEAEKL